jgi:hypothetical protein
MKRTILSLQIQPTPLIGTILIVYYYCDPDCMLRPSISSLVSTFAGAETRSTSGTAALEKSNHGINEMAELVEVSY